MLMKPYYSLTFRMLLLAILLVACDGLKKEKSEYGKATQALIALLDENPDVKSMLEASIEKANQVNPDRNTNPVKNLEEYFAFVTWAETTMPWSLVKKEAPPDIFNDIFQGIAYFYFLIDQPLPELEGKGYVNNSIQYTEPFATWLTGFCKTWGQYLDSEGSWNSQYYEMALADSNFGLQNGWYEDPSHWKSFNEFFARHLVSSDVRPIASPEDNSVVVSFADSEPQGVWKIDSASNLVMEDGVPVKSATLRSVKNLIGEDSEYEEDFANGTFTHAFLNVNDYHRYHFPVSGVVKEVRIIPAGNPIGGRLWWDAENNRYAYDPSAKTGWQTLETRGCVIVDTEEYGLVALLPIGMVVVGSVNFEDQVQPGARVKKGDMLGYFQFGGSDFIMIFQDKVEFTLRW